MIKRQFPNIILLVLDTQRFDRLSTYAYHRQTSPHLDDFGRQATVFENAVAPAQWTVPAHASMFTGEYPATHQLTQGRDRLDSWFEVVAGLLAAAGYRSTGFCNNPLVGVLDNGLKRGFETFYNYGGVFPATPRSATRRQRDFGSIRKYAHRLRELAHPLQNACAHSDLLFRLSLNPRLAPLWTRLAHSKGNTVNCLADLRHYLKQVFEGKNTEPQFIFVNLMETHLPYAPPATFIDKFAPYFKADWAAQHLMHAFNSQLVRWLLPLGKPLTEMESMVLNDLYDAEVNYQDHLLAEVLEWLTRKDIGDNTLTIIVADHGEGLGEHDYIGHTFFAYQELVHVPLIIKFPNGLAAGTRISTAVSTRRIFHTLLEAAGVRPGETQYRSADDVGRLSLTRTVQGQDPEHGLVFAEAYTRHTLLSLMESQFPELSEIFACKFNRRAVFSGRYKLVRVDGLKDELFDVSVDAFEENNISARHPEQTADLAKKMDAFVANVVVRRPGRSPYLEADEDLTKRLRNLGYIE